MFLHEHHDLFGWILVSTITAHGLYFLRVYINFSPIKLGSGIFAWAILLILAGFGVYMRYMLKVTHNTRSKLIHSILGFSFLVMMIVHLLL